MAPWPHLVMEQLPLVHVCKRQVAAAPSHATWQFPRQVSMLHEPPALHESMLQLPPVQFLRRQVGWSPVHCIEQLPTQLGIVQLAPLHGSEQLPAFVQSKLHAAPAAQLVWHLPAG